jgi:hypothetical protein
MPVRIVLALLCVVVSGCFPVEVDVSERGELLVYRHEGFFIVDPATKKTKPVIGPGADQPIFGRFVPGKDEILTVVVDSVESNRFELVKLSDGAKRKIHSDRNCCYALFSPNGRYLAITNFAQRSVEKDNVTHFFDVPELTVIDLEKNHTKRFAEIETFPLVRWFKDNQRLLAMVTTEKSDGRKVLGHLCEIDVATGKTKKLISIASEHGLHFALSPDNSKILVIADKVGPPDAKLKRSEPARKVRDDKPDSPNAGVVSYAGEDGISPIREFDVAKGSLRTLDIKGQFVIYSPNGKKILLNTKKKDSGEDELIIADANGDNRKTIAEDYCFQPPSGGVLESGGGLYPSWVGNDSIVYFSSRSTFGTSAKAAWLKFAKIDGTLPSVLQPYLDVAALEAEQTIRNPRWDPAMPANAVEKLLIPLLPVK